MNALTPSKCSPTNLKIYFACIGTGSWKEISACLKFPSLLLPIALDLGSQCAALRPNGSFLTELNRIFFACISRLSEARQSSVDAGRSWGAAFAALHWGRWHFLWPLIFLLAPVSVCDTRMPLSDRAGAPTVLRMREHEKLSSSFWNKRKNVFWSSLNLNFLIKMTPRNDLAHSPNLSFPALQATNLVLERFRLQNNRDYKYLANLSTITSNWLLLTK